MSQRRSPGGRGCRVPTIAVLLALSAIASPANANMNAEANANANAPTPGAAAVACPTAGTGITLSLGFCATVFADNLGHVRHLTVAADGTVYANSWSGRYYHNDTPPAARESLFTSTPFMPSSTTRSCATRSRRDRSCRAPALR